MPQPTHIILHVVFAMPSIPLQNVLLSHNNRAINRRSGKGACCKWGYAPAECMAGIRNVPRVLFLWGRCGRLVCRPASILGSQRTSMQSTPRLYFFENFRIQVGAIHRALRPHQCVALPAPPLGRACTTSFCLTSVACLRVTGR